MRRARTAPWIAALLAVTLCACTASARGNPGETAKPVFEMRDGTAFLPGWDDRASSQPPELLSIDAGDFEKPAHVYSDRVIFGEGSVTTRAFRMPDTATTLSVVARGVPEAGIFPRLRVSVTADGATTTTVYEGYLQSLGMARIACPVPRDVRGRQARVSVEFLNPSALNDHRQVWLARVVVE